MGRLRELLDQLSFEKLHRSRKPAAFPLLRKLLGVVPDAVAFALFNFGSSFGPQSISEPEPQPPRTVPQLTLDSWTGGGLPLSDSVADAVTFSTYELVDDPVFALREIHRVARSGARVTVPLRTTWSDPLQKRLGTREALAPFFDASARARQLGVDGLFTAVTIQDNQLVLEAIKGTTAPHPPRIDIGCGTAKRDGFAGIDVLPLPGVDILRDVDRYGLPFSDGTIAAVHSSHFLEHVRDLVFVMNEIHRVCVDGAVVTLVVPTLLGPWAAADPTHVRLFNARSFGYFAGESAGGYAGIAAKFDLIAQQVGTEVRVTLRVVKGASGTP
jgi:hypothetical protein